MFLIFSVSKVKTRNIPFTHNFVDQTDRTGHKLAKDRHGQESKQQIILGFCGTFWDLAQHYVA